MTGSILGVKRNNGVRITEFSLLQEWNNAILWRGIMEADVFNGIICSFFTGIMNKENFRAGIME